MEGNGKSREGMKYMYQANGFRQVGEDAFSLQIPTDRDYQILQLTDLHLGFGLFSRKKDQLAMRAVTELIGRTKPDLIVLTGDSIFPFFPKAGTMNNRKEAQRFRAFMDSFRIPYTLVFGNHDCEMGAACGKEELAEIFKSGTYCIFTEGKKELSGVGNFFLNLTGQENEILLPLVMLDSNMYGDGWFFSGFDCIHSDQTAWCMERLSQLKEDNPEIFAMAFFHMPPREFKEAYEKMKLGDRSVVYCHGSVGEKDEYFGISNRKGDFFPRAVENGVIKWMFCGHDHLNTLSLIYQGIRLTYGMSIDYLGYSGIAKQYVQRGATLITRKTDGNVEVSMVPLGAAVSTRVRGEKAAQL